MNDEYTGFWIRSHKFVDIIINFKFNLHLILILCIYFIWWIHKNVKKNQKPLIKDYNIIIKQIIGKRKKESTKNYIKNSWKPLDSIQENARKKYKAALCGFTNNGGT